MRGLAPLVLGAALALLPRATSADVAAVYREHCAVCHGAAGRGDGPAAVMQSPAPRDFTTGVFKFRSTPIGTLPTGDDVARTIRAGLGGTAMPGYEGLLDDATIRALADLVLSMAPDGARRGAALRVEAGPGAPPSVERGAGLYRKAGCAGCHGADGRGVPWRPAREGVGAGRAPTVLSEPWTFRAGRDPRSVATRILAGIDGTPMPGHAGRLTAADALSIAMFVEALARPPAWEAADPADVTGAGVDTDPVARGRYLVRAMLCPLCHTPISAEDGAYDAMRYLAGGMRVSAYPWGTWYSRNLTSDGETGLGRWTEAEIVAAVTRGVGRGGRRLDPMAMPWPWFAHLRESDARAIAAYLKGLPPARNPVPAAEAPPFPEAVGGKLLALLGLEVAVEFWGGNAGTDAAVRAMPVATRGRRAGAVALGWGTVAAGVAGLLLAAVRARGRVRGWGVAVASSALAGWVVLGAWPPLWLMSPETTTRWLFLGTPRPAAGLAGAERALVERGEYVATIAPCGLCHTPALAFVGFSTRRTLAGGMEARWRVYGSAVSTNLTPAGLAGHEIRAIRSGLGHDGRRMHWQAMPWDILSNWSEEDLRALLAYLRALPPVAGATPPPRPPAPGDPLADAFFFGDAARR